MRSLKVALGIIVALFALHIGWQVGAAELTYIELQDDMRDLASQAAARLGYAPPNSDEDFRRAVLSKAARYHIRLQPESECGPFSLGDKTTIYITADYWVRVNLLTFSFRVHFTPSSGRKGP